MEIELEEDKKKVKQEIPVYVTALFIALSGVAFLFFTVYYIAFLPVPAIMQPLRVRVLTTLQLEEALESDISFVEVIEAGSGEIYSQPDKESTTVARIAVGGYYEKLEEEGGWVRIRSRDVVFEGWIPADNVKEISE